MACACQAQCAKCSNWTQQEPVSRPAYGICSVWTNSATGAIVLNKGDFKRGPNHEALTSENGGCSKFTERVQQNR